MGVEGVTLNYKGHRKSQTEAWMRKRKSTIKIKEE
jgi:hypothetical protein